ncbi:MAG: glycosyltransferase family 39 protein [Oscillatoriales cyanobacterium SM2_2_1]|nr:glycosyltransferase family 39 protein [Oscillatoriales cyanobacterium SM2_2_1]
MTAEVIWTLVLGLLARGAIAWLLPPGFDEAYYTGYVRHPQMSYFDHPPMVGWVAGLGIALTGDVTQFSIRIGPLLLFTASLYFLYRTSCHLFDEATGRLTLILTSLVPFFGVGFGILTLPDSPLMFFWSACLWLASVEFFPKHSDDIGLYRPTWRVGAIGGLVGLASLGKYHGFLLGLGLVLFCGLSAPHRRVFRSGWLIGAIAAFVLFLSPMLIWNAQHDWVSFRFQGARAVPEGGYRIGDLLLTLLVGVAYLFPSFGVPLWWTNLRQVPAWQNPKYLWILCLSLPIYGGFTLMGGYRQVLPSWPMPGFFGAMLLLGHRMAIAQGHQPRLIRRWLTISGGIMVTLLLIALLHVRFGIIQKDGAGAIAGGIWQPVDDPSTQLIDVAQVRAAFQSSPWRESLEQADFVFSNNFFFAGQMIMALGKITDKPITCFDTDIRGFAYWSRARDFVGKNGLYLTSEQFQFFDQRAIADLAAVGETNPAWQLGADERLPAAMVYRAFFESMTDLGRIPLQRAGGVVQIVHVYRAQNLQRPYPRPYGYY